MWETHQIFFCLKRFRNMYVIKYMKKEARRKLLTLVHKILCSMLYFIIQIFSLIFYQHAQQSFISICIIKMIFKELNNKYIDRFIQKLYSFFFFFLVRPIAYFSNLNTIKYSVFILSCSIPRTDKTMIIRWTSDNKYGK